MEDALHGVPWSGSPEMVRWGVPLEAFPRRCPMERPSGVSALEGIPGRDLTGAVPWKGSPAEGFLEGVQFRGALDGYSGGVSRGTSR